MKSLWEFSVVSESIMLLDIIIVTVLICSSITVQVLLILVINLTMGRSVESKRVMVIVLNCYRLTLITRGCQCAQKICQAVLVIQHAVK